MTSMSDVETPQQALARLVDRYPGLPVMKLHTGCDEDDGHVLELTGAWLGGWWLAGGRVWDDFEDACHALGDDWTVDDHEEGAVLPDDLPHGRCIWVSMDTGTTPSADAEDKMQEHDRNHGDMPPAKLCGKIVYLSGPVSGLDREDCVARFGMAREACLKAGAVYVYDPMEVVPKDSTHEDAMALCLNGLTACRPLSGGDVMRGYDVLVSLPMWERSDGATMERAVADACGIACVDLHDVTPL